MKRIETVLAATDLSAPARHAAMRAALLASRADAGLTLLHVVSLQLMENLRRLAGRSGEATERRLTAEVMEELSRLATDIARRWGVEAEARLAEGSVLKEIVGHADALGADLVVMGARGAGFVRELLLGSTTERVLRLITRPVLMVKQMPHGPYQRVLVAVDFSERSVTALRLAHLVAPEAHFIVLNAFQPPFEHKLRQGGADDFEIMELRDAARREAVARMDELTAACADIPSERITRLVLPGPALDCVLEQEQEQDCDLIVVGKHGYGRVEEMLLGSLTKHLLVLSGCDVLVATQRST
ncbi:MAG: universal stress protein [Pseudomonadota bacterium]|jgi:nucleotide-binding universal stress UspA family protein